MVEMLLASQLGYVFISESVLFIGTQFSNLYTDTLKFGSKVFFDPKIQLLYL
jgi:hypothetical protein